MIGNVRQTAHQPVQHITNAPTFQMNVVDKGASSQATVAFTKPNLGVLKNNRSEEKQAQKSSEEGQGWVLPPNVYGDTEGSGIYVSSPLLPIFRMVLKDPMVKKLFARAKKKGLVSITEEPRLQLEATPVNGDEVRNTSTGESRIRIANADHRYAIAALVHELVHSATPENLNSKVEEFYAENLGRGIYRRITGDSTLEMKPFSIIANLYPQLPFDNYIRQYLNLILNS